MKVGYKGFKLNENGELCGRDTIFRIGEVVSLPDKPDLATYGFHFCWDINDIHKFYSLHNSVICAVEILGDIDSQADHRSACTNKIKVLRVLTEEEILQLSNIGFENAGIINKGNWNTGDENIGDSNAGDENVGDCNSGSHNLGCWNSGNGNVGYFNTENNQCFIFDQPSDMTIEEFRDSEYYRALISAPFELTTRINGQLHKYTYNEACAKWWDKLSDNAKSTIKRIPNFDADKFYQITGIKLT